MTEDLLALSPIKAECWHASETLTHLLVSQMIGVHEQASDLQTCSIQLLCLDVHHRTTSTPSFLHFLWEKIFCWCMLLARKARFLLTYFRLSVFKHCSLCLIGSVTADFSALSLTKTSLKASFFHWMYDPQCVLHEHFCWPWHCFQYPPCCCPHGWRFWLWFINYVNLNRWHFWIFAYTEMGPSLPFLASPVFLHLCFLCLSFSHFPLDVCSKQFFSHLIFLAPETNNNRVPLCSRKQIHCEPPTCSIYTT